MADRVRKLRTEKGWTQAELAGAAGISQQAIANLENGDVQRPRFIIEIASALGVTPERLKAGRDGKQMEIDSGFLFDCLTAARVAAIENGWDDPPERDLMKVAVEMYRIHLNRRGHNLDQAAQTELLRFLAQSRAK